MMRHFGLGFLLCNALASFASAQPAPGSELFADRTPAYFVDRYGSATSSVNAAQHAFLHPRHGNVEIKRQFSIRGFRDGDLRVKAVFYVPSLKLASVILQLPRRWTEDQIEAALAAYGGEWNPEGSKVVFRTWSRSDGARAIFTLTSLEIQLPEIVSALDERVREEEAQKKVVPKF
jgi:hypothetical protein